MGPDVRPGHGLTRVLSFGSPSGRRDQMTAWIRRREFITLLGGAAAVAARGAGAAAGKMRADRRPMHMSAERCGVTDPPRGVPARSAAIWLDRWPQRAHRRSLGRGRYRAHSQICGGAGRARPDVIFAPAGNTVARIAEATRTIPIVFAAVIDPVGAGFVESMARPGGNATGFSRSNTPSAANGSSCSRRSRQAVTRAAVLSGSHLCRRDRPVCRNPGGGARSAWS